MKNLITPLVLVIFAISSATAVYAGQSLQAEFSWGMVLMGLLGGLAFFLFGMGKMSSAMKKITGNKMRAILAALTRNRVTGFFVGAFVTMVIQSSSATVVMLVSFVQAGLMGFTRSMGVILGADIGTTLTAQLVAFKLTDYALLMVVVGFSVRALAKKEQIRNIGEVLFGFGVLFYGIKLMGDATKPLRTYQEVLSFMEGLENPMMGVFVGAVFTAIIQSSSASTGVVIVLAQQGLIRLEAGIPLILGANIGTCVTAGIASIGTSREAKRVALAHAFFKIAGVLFLIFWIPGFSEMIRSIGFYFNTGYARNIANAHTVFNVGIGLLFLPFTGLFAKMILKILPDKKDVKGITPATWHLDESLISTPPIAIGLARTEISRVAKLLGRMLRAVIVPFISDPDIIQNEVESKEEARSLVKEIPMRDEIFAELSLIDGIHMREEKIDFLDEKIREYLVKIAQQELTHEQSRHIHGMMSITNDMEWIGDIIHRNMIPLIGKKKCLNVDFSQEGKEELMIYHGRITRQIRLLEEAFAEMNPEKAAEILTAAESYSELESAYREQHLERVFHGKENSIKTHEVHMELMDLMQQISVHSSNVAKTFISSCG